ncbi:thiamine phosphate synthase [Candidatus Marsarchaeota archaeon]|nr:thiamine phosphate synthase [Candidatus Marsarchaeota archaeon]
MDHEESAKVFLDAGIRVIQYREKVAASTVQIEEARRIKMLCRDYNAIFIVNDRVDVAVAASADGLHIGQSDTGIIEARKLFKDGIIGVSATNVGEAIKAERQGAAYLGVGSIFPTGTKSDAVITGLDELKRIRRNTTIPIYAIGGIKFKHLKEIKGHGADGVALISSILSAEDPVAEARRYAEEWKNLSISK